MHDLNSLLAPKQVACCPLFAACTTFSDQCTTCSDTGCTFCAPGFRVLNSDCTACTLAGCTSYPGPQCKCGSCGDGFRPTPINSGAGCARACNQIVRAEAVWFRVSCAIPNWPAAHYLSGCVSPPSPRAGCTTGCKTCSDTACTQCSSGYRMNSGACQRCGVNCLACPAAINQCLQCIPGFTARQGSCVSCSSAGIAITGCSRYSEGCTFCDTCGFGYKPTPNGNSCQGELTLRRVQLHDLRLEGLCMAQLLALRAL